MAVRIRLRRIGKKKQPQYRLVVAEAVSPRDGRFIESIGRYNPRVNPPVISVDEERALSWLYQFFLTRSHRMENRVRQTSESKTRPQG